MCGLQRGREGGSSHLLTTVASSAQCGCVVEPDSAEVRDSVTSKLPAMWLFQQLVGKVAYATVGVQGYRCATSKEGFLHPTHISDIRSN